MAKKTETVESTETEVEQTTAEPTTEDAPTEKKTKAPVDLTDFNAALAEAIEAAGDSSEPTEESVTKVLSAFHALEGRAKTAARKAIRDGILESLDKDEIAAAQTLNKLNGALDEAPAKASTPKAAKAPVDPTQAHVEKGATLTIALALLGQHAAEGVADDAQEKIDSLYSEGYAPADAYFAWLDSGKEGDEPEASDVAKAAAKLVVAKKVRASSGGSTGGAVRTYSGPPRATQKHIEEAFSDVEVGTHLTVGEIVNKPSKEYGKDKPSAGAISGALKSAKFAVAGVTPDAEDATPYGATKSA